MRAYNPEFIKLLLKPDRRAQKQLFEELYAPMFRVCQRYIVQTDEVEDCVLKAFMKVFQQLSSFEVKDEFGLYWWIRKIVVNESLSALRKKHHFLMIAQENLPEVSVDANIVDKLNAEDLQQLVMRLPTGYRTVFSLHVVEGYEHKEIAGMLGISESTSKTQLLKAKIKLRQLIDKQGYSYGSMGS